MKFLVEITRTVKIMKEIEAESADEAERVAHSLEDSDDRVTIIDSDDQVEHMEDENKNVYYYSNIHDKWKMEQRRQTPR